MSSSPTSVSLVSPSTPGPVVATSLAPAAVPLRSRSVQLRTEVPGPRSRELIAARTQAIPQCAHNATPIFMVRGQGAVIEDVDGNHLLDLTGSFGALNVGHAHPRLVKAVQEAAAR